jgi:eukaryotic-like serine/threonine-protein kinase
MSVRALSAAERTVGKYRIIGQLGEGGQARVYLALMTGPGSFHKLLVLKVLRESAQHDRLVVDAFMQEARLAAQVNHPGIVQTYEVGEERGSHYIAMEYVKGQSLRALNRRLAADALPLHIHLGILADVARALHYTHTLKDFDGSPLNLVHRDVSPQNVMVSYEGAVKLLDFGIAKVSGNDELTQDGMIKGKVAYMAPEQIRGGALDRRADVFSLGVMVFQAVTGKPFAGGNEVPEVTKMQHRLEGSEPRLRQVAPDAPAPLIELCDRALCVDPKDRQESAEQLADEIGTYLLEISSGSYPRELARIMATSFGEERRAVDAMIDEQVRLAMSEAADHTNIPPMYEISIDQPSGTPPTVYEGQQRAAPRGGRNMGWVAAGLVTFVALVGVGVFLWNGRGEGPRRDDMSDIAADSRSEQRAPLPSESVPNSVHLAEVTPSVTIRVRIDAEPAGAHVELDGERITVPAELTRPRDGSAHVVDVRAPGHIPERRRLTFDGDVDVDVALRRFRERPSRAEPEHAQQATSAEPERPRRDPVVDPAEGEERPRVLRARVDVEDPYQ